MRSLRGIAALLTAVVLGVVLCELGLRLYFFEYEADRTYWGRGAFREADGLPYRHAPSTTAAIGRAGSFGPHYLRTNSLGFRDRREPGAGSPEHRVMMIGASFMFGVGIERYEDLFHVQLERELRARPDWPDDLAVYNLSQTGFNLDSLIRLARRHLDTYRPQVLLMVLPTVVWNRQPPVDVVDGYLLPTERWLRGSVLDRLRTGSYLVMRWRNPLRGAWEFHGRTLGLSASDEGVRVDPRDPPELRDQRGLRMLDDLVRLNHELRRRRIGLFTANVGRFSGISRWNLGSRGIPTMALEPIDDWLIPGDRHWNERGHREVAARVSRTLPAWAALAETAR